MAGGVQWGDDCRLQGAQKRHLRRAPVESGPLPQQYLRALVVLLASLSLLAVLTARSAVELPSSHAVAQHSGHWCGSLRLDTFGRDEGIVIPPVPARPVPTEGIGFLDSATSYFDSNQPAEIVILPAPQRRRPVTLLSYELPDDGDVLTPVLDDMVIPPVPPPAGPSVWGNWICR